MTIVNVIIHDGCACLVTDTKATSALGPEWHVPKARALPHMRLALATRGNIHALDKVALAISQHADDYASARGFLELCFAGLDLGDVDIFLVGHDGENPAACMISNVNTGSKILDIDQILTTPQVSEEDFEKFTRDPVAGLVDFVQAQCVSDPRCGGWINVTQVGPTVIESYTVGVAHG